MNNIKDKINEIAPVLAIIDDLIVFIFIENQDKYTVMAIKL